MTDPALRAAVGQIYKEVTDEYLASHGSAAKLFADDPDRAPIQQRVGTSVAWLGEHMGEVPVLLIPCIKAGKTLPEGNQAGLWGSLLPAAWSYALAARARGLGTAWTTLHLQREAEVAELLGIPGRIPSGCAHPDGVFHRRDVQTPPPVNQSTTCCTWTDGELIYSAICSIDGYVADEQGNFDWAVPDAQVHAFVNELERGVGTYLLGRRMYETMIPWETMASEDLERSSVAGGPSAPDEFAGIEAATAEFAQIWGGIDKIVYSTTLNEVSTARTTIARDFDADAVRALESEAVQDISIGGPTVAVSAFAAGLVDEVRLFLCPVNIGGGLRALPESRLDLQLLEEKTFDGGVIYSAIRRSLSNHHHCRDDAE